jgi:hypothetical protein
MFESEMVLAATMRLLSLFAVFLFTMGQHVILLLRILFNVDRIELELTCTLQLQVDFIGV